MLEVYWNVIDFSKLKNKSEGGLTYTQMKIFKGYINYHVTKSEVLQGCNKSHSINHFNYSPWDHLITEGFFNTSDKFSTFKKKFRTEMNFTSYFIPIFCWLNFHWIGIKHLCICFWSINHILFLPPGLVVMLPFKGLK